MQTLIKKDSFRRDLISRRKSMEVTDMRIVLLGAPGAGKGTQAAMIEEEFNITHISTGDIFRDNIRDMTPLGIVAKSYIDKGMLCPDDVTINLIREALVSPKVINGFILDGFPRTLVQAQTLDKLLTENNIELDFALNIIATDESIISRISGRRVCPNCGAVYHIVYIPPKVENICDVCNTQIIQRDDDTEETMRKRLETYHHENVPLVDYYQKKCKLVEIESTHGVHENWHKLKKLLEGYK